MIPRDHLHRTDVPVEPGLCFVLMPFGDKMDDIYNAGIRPALENLGMRPHRADESFSSTDIMSEVLDNILRSEVIIADLTGKNPNVFYELGLAHAMKQHVILITQSREDVPFDLAGIRYFAYENTMAGARVLAQNLEKIVRQLRSAPSPHAAELQQTQQLLQRAFKAWVGVGDITLTLNEFSMIALYMEDLTLDDERLAFIAAGAAYFGRHLARATSKVARNPYAIQKLVTTIAHSPMLRPAWRAAAMLEHCDQSLVSQATSTALIGDVLNEERADLLTRILPARGTLRYLRDLAASTNATPEMRGKAEEAVRQISAEFSLKR